MSAIRRLLAVLLVIPLAACDPVTEPVDARVRVLGTIGGFNSDDPRLTIEPSGRGVEVRVITYGAGCDVKGEADVSREGMTVIVSPFDYAARPGTPCTRLLAMFEHRAVVQFPASGTATVRVRGLARGAAVAMDTIVVERSIQLP